MLLRACSCLDLRDSGLDAAGLAALCPALSPSLEHLRLGINDLSSDGTVSQAGDSDRAGQPSLARLTRLRTVGVI